MDLIDRGALIDKYEKVRELAGPGAAMLMELVIAIAEDAPSIEANEDQTYWGYKVKHLAAVTDLLRKNRITPDDVERISKELGYAMAGWAIRQDTSSAPDGAPSPQGEGFR